MTLQKDQIQALIQEIEEVLNKTSPRLPWVMSNEALRQRQVLEQAQQSLILVQQQMAEGGLAPRTEPAGQPAESAQQVLQAVLQEMTYLRTNMLQPLRSDVESLRQQREALTQEIRQLEAQKQQALPQAVNQQALMEFLQAAMVQLQENLTGQVVQMMATLSSERPLLEASPPPEASLPMLSPAQRLEQMQIVQSQSDRLLTRLDTTLRIIFDSLQRNIQDYQDSLEQGINRMHNLGQQSETLFSAMVSRLAQQFGREASAYLQSSMQSDWTIDKPSLPGQEEDLAEAESSDAQIARLLNELNTLGRTQPAAGSAASNAQRPSDFLSFESNPERLELLDQELRDLDLSTLTPEPDFAADEDITIFQGDEEFTLLQPPDMQAERNFTPDAEIAPVQEDELDSALDMLNQLSTEAESQPEAAPTAEPTEPEPIEADVPLVPAPEALYEDEFYQSLFGGNVPPPDDPDAITILEANSPELSSEVVLPPSEAAELAWLEGLDEPVEEPEPAADAPIANAPDRFLEAELPQTVEQFLLQPNAASPSDDLFDMGFDIGSEADAQPVEVEPLPEDVETIAALTDLIQLSHSDPGLPELQTELDRQDDDRYEPACPDENLLGTETPKPDMLVDLRLPADALQQLTEDLSQLETTETADVDLNVTHSEDWTIANWPEDNPPNAASTEPAADTEPLTLGSFFSDVESPIEHPAENSIDLSALGDLESDPDDATANTTEMLLPDLFGDVEDRPEQPSPSEANPEPHASSPAIEPSTLADLFADAAELPSVSDSDADLFGGMAAAPEPAAESSELRLDQLFDAEAPNTDAFNADALTPDSTYAEAPESVPTAASEPAETGWTLEDFAAEIPAAELPTAEPDRLAQTEPSAAEPTERVEAFTLDGLETLFETLPGVARSNSVSETDTSSHSFTAEDVFGDVEAVSEQDASRSRADFLRPEGQRLEQEGLLKKKT